MTEYEDEERQQNIDSLKDICKSIGCSGMDKDMCENRPHYCKIIREILRDEY